MRTLLAVGLLGLAGCAMTPDRAEPSLYEQLGGPGGVATLVDELIEILATDLRVAPAFANTDIKRFRTKLNEQLCELSGGPCRYTGDSMADAHSGLNITHAQFNALVEDLQLAMDRVAIPEAAQNRLLRLLAPMRGDVVHK
jgi:hemoglobin